jgi:hypothetical protein
MSGKKKLLDVVREKIRLKLNCPEKTRHKMVKLKLF